MNAQITKKEENPNPYQELVQQISTAFTYGQTRAIAAVHSCLVETYWEIGQHIVEYEQQGKERAVYGTALLENLSRDLKMLHGKGFSRSNLSYMRLFYIRYPICEKASHKLSWSHYFELLKIEDDLERNFYEKQALLEKWSVPELKRQKDSALYLRLALSKEKDELLIEYATYGMTSQLFVSKYQLYLPNEEELKRLVNQQLELENI
jgi:hypothetical protein